MLAKKYGVNGTSEWIWWNEAVAAWTSVTFDEGISLLMKARGKRPVQTSAAAPVAQAGPLDAPFGGTKIVCVGRNYRPHAEELGNTVPKEPLWFMKPPSSLTGPGSEIRLPANHGRIDYEGEVALVIGAKASGIRRENATEIIAGVTAALDITARELQKSDGQWTRAKGFDTFCPLGPVVLPFGAWAENLRLTTVLNGKTAQDDRTSSLVFSFADLLTHLSECMTLMPGDLVLTGTPAGVGPLSAGDDIYVDIMSDAESSDLPLIRLPMRAVERLSH